MKRNLLLITINLVILCWMFGMIPLSVIAGEDDERKNRFPIAVIENDKIDMGQITEGTRQTGEIKITNIGEEDLLIGRVRSSCGLVIPNWPEDPVEKDDEVIIRFRYDTSRLGPFERKVIIHTNGWQKDLIITVSGEVIPPE
ncbi:MAG: DUF1573 domain-containing protein [Bacteroidales bacterium]